MKKYSHRVETRVRTTSWRVGFTLIELLVVISIIALLLAILMPSLQLAKDHAKTLLCQTKTKDMALAFQIYANEHRYLPHAYTYGRRMDENGNPTTSTGSGGIFALNTLVVLQMEKYGIDPLTGYICPANKSGYARRWWEGGGNPGDPWADRAELDNRKHGSFYADDYCFYAYLDGQDLPPNTVAFNPENVFAPVATHNRMSSRHALLGDLVLQAFESEGHAWCHHWDYGHRKGFSTAYGDAHVEWSNMGWEFYQKTELCQYEGYTGAWFYWWK